MAAPPRSARNSSTAAGGEVLLSQGQSLECFSIHTRPTSRALPTEVDRIVHTVVVRSHLIDLRNAAWEGSVSLAVENT